MKYQRDRVRTDEKSRRTLGLKVPRRLQQSSRCFNVADRVADTTGFPIDEGMPHDMLCAVSYEFGMDHLVPEKQAAR